ncbi:hypothetical protein NMG60_11030118 [Bertholletia excelsa]
MESRLNINSLGGENNFVMTPTDQRDDATSNSDIMTRRLKNRERQRRYRARKRLEADMKKTCTLNNPTVIQVEPQVNEIILNNCVTGERTSIHCRRNWKKDARRAHMVREQIGLSNENQATLLPSGAAEAKPPMENEFQRSNWPVQDGSERRITPGRRHWKAEARNKKN